VAPEGAVLRLAALGVPSCGRGDRPRLRDHRPGRSRWSLERRLGAAVARAGLVSAAILVLIGARTLWNGIRAQAGLEAPEDVLAPSHAFLTAVAATALNPLTIGLWTVSFPAAAPEHATTSIAAAAAVLVGVGLGTLSWYGGFSTAVALVRRRVGDRLLRFVELVSGCGLIGFGGLLGYRSLRAN
jgi:threonine/homoserine/homoserine lactone efflux protein